MKTFLLKNGKLLVFTLIFSIAYYWFAYHLDRKNIYDLFLCYAISFGTYFYLLNTLKPGSQRLFQYMAIFLRLLFLFSIPPLSDDYFRFIWDGQLIFNGLNPFDHLPTEVTIDFPNKAELLVGMNSPDYYTVYPPIAQCIYFVSVYLSPNSIFGSIVAMRLILLAAEIGVIFLLPKLLQALNVNSQNSLWYTLNPLVIIELSGNLHFEGIVVFFFLLAVYLLVLQKEKLAAIPWALAAAAKLIPIFFLPILIRKLKFKNAILIYVLVAIVFIILWLPFYNETFFSHFSQSVNLYYKTFEFNASVYYIVRWFGYLWVDYNIIQTAGPWLSKAAIIGLVYIQIKRKFVDWPTFFSLLLFALSWYYAFALIVHPWYMITLVFLSVFTKYRFAILWSALIVLSYWAYGNPEYRENYGLITLEYIGVFSFSVYELLNSRNTVKGL